MSDANIILSDMELLSRQNVLADEELFDRYPTWEWAFKQYRFINLNLKIDIEGKKICLDLSNTNHVYNKHGEIGEDKCRRKLWQVLLDSQSTYDVIVNPALVTNICKCKQTLQLQTQAGDYKIDKIANMAEVGTVWFYTNSIINILSQHRMVTLNKWDIDYITRNYKVSGDIDDLSYKVTTEE